MGADWVNTWGTWVSAIGTWVSSVVVLVSVFILRGQLRATRRTIRSAAVQGCYVLWGNIGQFLVQHPDLRPFLYKGKPLDSSVDEPLRAKVEGALEMILDSMANLFHQLPNLQPEEREAYGNFLKQRYQTQPALRQFVEENGSWYPNSFTEFLHSEIKWAINKEPQNSTSPQKLPTAMTNL